MQKWEYVIAVTSWDSSRKSWVAKFADGEISGRDTLLNYYGSQGWELVNVVPQYLDGTSEKDASQNVNEYALFFKRPEQ